MGKYDVEGSSEKEQPGCHCSTAVGFLLVLLAVAIAVGVGIIVHFAGKREDDVVCKFNVTGMVSADAARQACIALAVQNDAAVCNVCPEKTTTSHMTSKMMTTSVAPTTAAPSTYKMRLPSNLKPISYTVYLRPDFYSQNTSNFIFTGRSSVKVTCEQETSEIVMHLKDLHLAENSVVVQEENAVENLYESHFLVDGPQLLVIKTKSPLMAGKSYMINFEDFSAPIRRDYTGLYYGSFMDNGTRDYYLVTQMEVVEARKVFPCFDEPAMKATFQMTVARHQDRVAVSNTPIESTNTLTGGWVEDKFEVTPIMPTYLLALAIGNFVYSERMTSNGIQTRIYSREAAKDQNQYSTDIGARILTYFENYFGIPFPIKKQDMVAVTAFQFGAMENWGMIVFKEQYVLFKPGYSSFDDQYFVSLVVSHEIAHNWFGNLVSPAWWDDLWLNEGFATFMQFKGMDAMHPEWNVYERMVDQTFKPSMALDGLASSHPIYIEGVEDPNEILQYFDAISYRKGCSIIRMIEYVIGRSSFEKGLKNYLTELSYGNARHQDLWRALGNQATLDNVTYHDVSGFAETWIYQSGFPVVNVEYTEEGKLRLTQKRFLSNPGAPVNEKFPSRFGYRWDIPFTYTTSTEQNFDVSQKDIIMMNYEDGAVHIESNMVPAPTGSNWVIGNLHMLGFFRVNYDERNWNALMDQLKTDHTAIYSLNRYQIIFDAWNLARSGDLDMSIALRTLEYIGQETGQPQLLIISSEVMRIHIQMYSKPIYGKFQAFMRRTWEPLFSQVGFEGTGQNDQFYNIRAIVSNLACTFGVESCVQQSKDLLAQWMANPDTRPSGINAEISQTVYCTAVRHGGEAEWTFILEKYKTENSESEKFRLLGALACTQHMWLVAKFLDMSLDTNIVATSDASRVASSMTSNTLASGLWWDFYRTHVDTFISRLGLYWNMDYLSKVATTFNSNPRLEELKQLGEEKGFGNYATYNNIIESVTGNIERVSKIAPVIEAWLDKQGI